MKVLTTPLGCMFTCVTAVDLAIDSKLDSLENSKIPLPTNAGIVVHKAVCILHRPTTTLIPILAHTYSELWLSLFCRRGRFCWVTVEDLSSQPAHIAYHSLTPCVSMPSATVTLLLRAFGLPMCGMPWR